MQAVLYMLAVLLLMLAGLGVTAGRASLSPLAAAAFVAAFAWPALSGLLS